MEPIRPRDYAAELVTKIKDLALDAELVVNREVTADVRASDAVWHVYAAGRDPAGGADRAELYKTRSEHSMLIWLDGYRAAKAALSDS